MLKNLKYSVLYLLIAGLAGCASKPMPNKNVLNWPELKAFILAHPQLPKDTRYKISDCTHQERQSLQIIPAEGYKQIFGCRYQWSIKQILNSNKQCMTLLGPFKYRQGLSKEDAELLLTAAKNYGKKIQLPKNPTPMSMPNVDLPSSPVEIKFDSCGAIIRNQITSK